MTDAQSAPASLDWFRSDAILAKLSLAASHMDWTDQVCLLLLLNPQVQRESLKSCSGLCDPCMVYPCHWWPVTWQLLGRLCR